MAKTQFTHNKHALSPKRVLGAVSALIVAFLLLASVISVAQKYVGIRSHIRELSLEQQTLQDKYQSLTSMNEYMTTPQGQEQVLRAKYNVVKPGENVIVFDPQPIAVSESPSRAARWWKAILHGLGIGKE